MEERGSRNAKLETISELEKGEVGFAPLNEESRRSWISGGLSVSSKILLSLTALATLLWYRGLFACGLSAFAPESPRPLQVSGVPSYAIDYAPLVWLDVNEKYFPSDMYAQILNTAPMVNFTAIDVTQSPLTLDNLDSLNSYGNDGKNVYLTSLLDVTTGPKWLNGVVPDSSGKTNDATSCALIVNDHGSGLVDVFYMYFYAYNQGNTVLFHELGDHIGDWEHNMIRFQDGVPQQVWYSQHSNGEAFTYTTVEKEGVRPISYSARGSHANYAIAGTHDHTIPDLNLPRGLIQDYTSKGRLWDPVKSTYLYTYDAETTSFHSADGESPVGAMYFKGQWGDQQYARSDPRQEEFLGFYKYTGGPTGPQDKQLNRTKVCPDDGILCIIRDSLGP